MDSAFSEEAISDIALDQWFLILVLGTPLFNTPDSDYQLVRRDSMNWTQCVR